ncbi:MAG: hypothetical protein CM15mP60_1390 [Alphaproteobacteria bacterium]|nr:MAG: hypothetical protein CM15mP60_1390 [Alphaproteobacteria bacterium]
MFPSACVTCGSIGNFQTVILTVKRAFGKLISVKKSIFSEHHRGKNEGLKGGPTTLNFPWRNFAGAIKLPLQLMTPFDALGWKRGDPGWCWDDRRI